MTSPSSDHADPVGTRHDGGQQLAADHGSSGARVADELRSGDETTFRLLVERLPNVISYVAALDAQSTTTYISPQVEAILGHAAAAFVQDPGFWQQCLHPEDRDRVLAEVAACHRTGRPLNTQYRMIHRDGRAIWFQDMAELVTAPDGRPLHLLGVNADITARIEAEEALRKSAARLEEAQRLAHIGDWEWDLRRKTLHWSEEIYRIFGLVREGFTPSAEAFEAMIHPDDREDFLHRRQTMLEERKYACIDHRIVLPSGEVRHVQERARLILDERGEVIRVIGTVQDVTEQVHAERALQESEAVRRQALESAPDAVFAVDHGYRLLFNNHRHQQLLAASGSRPLRVGESILQENYPQDVRAHWQAAYDRALRGEQFRMETEWTIREGGRLVFENIFAPLRAPDGTILGVLVVAHDVTARSRLLLERAAAEARLAAVQEEERRRLARELHDQTAQRLVALAVDLKNLETDLAAGRPHQSVLRSLRAAVDDLQQQVRALAWDLRAGELVEGGLEHALRAYVEEWSERAGVAADCEIRGSGPGLPPGPLETTLYRVVQEALANAAKHARAGRVSILLEHEADLVRLTVEDDGRGFDPDALQTSSGVATRFGLLGMRERVALVGGTLMIESSPGTGTTILVRVPLRTGEGTP